MKFLLFALLLIDRSFDLFSDPFGFFFIEDMEILNSNSLAVSNFQGIDEFSEFPGLLHAEKALNLRGVEIKLSV